MEALQMSQWLRLEELALGKQTGAAATSLCVMRETFEIPAPRSPVGGAAGNPLACVLPV